MKKFLLLIVLIPLFAEAQYDKLKEYNSENMKSFIQKGNVKSIVSCMKKIFNDDSLFYKKNWNLISNGNISDIDKVLTTKYNHFNNIDTIIQIDLNGKLLYQYIYSFDYLNRITLYNNINEYSKNQIDCFISYDSIGRKLGEKCYNKSGQFIKSDTIIYHKNKVIIYKNASHSDNNKIVYYFKKHKIKMEVYVPNFKNISSKTIETRNKINKHKIIYTYNSTGKFISKKITISNVKEGSYLIINNCKNCGNPEMKVDWKNNDKGDIIYETFYFSSRYRFRNTYFNGTLKKTYEYIYDSHGNYTKKTEYIDGIPAYETTRTIEYYN